MFERGVPKAKPLTEAQLAGKEALRLKVAESKAQREQKRVEQELLQNQMKRES